MMRYIYVIISRSDLDADVAFKAWVAIYPEASRDEDLFMSIWSNSITKRGPFSDATS